MDADTSSDVDCHVASSLSCLTTCIYVTYHKATQDASMSLMSGIASLKSLIASYKRFWMDIMK